jgi:hypothetical protein
VVIPTILDRLWDSDFQMLLVANWIVRTNESFRKKSLKTHDFFASFLQARKCDQSFSFFVSGEPISLSGFGVAL